MHMKIKVHEKFIVAELRKICTFKFSIVACIVFSLVLLLTWTLSSVSIYAQTVTDPNLVVEPFAEGLVNATSMAFLDSHNILVLERDGSVRLVSDGELQSESILELPVNSSHVERGLLGITILNSTKLNSSGDRTGENIGMLNLSTVSNIHNYFSQTNNETSVQKNNTPTVFLYFTEIVSNTVLTNDSKTLEDDNLRNRVYKYDWNNETKTLENPALIMDLPALPGPNHNAGKLMIGPDNFLYGMIGDLLVHKGQVQNFRDGPPADNTSMIFRVNSSDGTMPASGNPFTKDPNDPLSKYYAYGVRNSFGLASDPITGSVWITENGESSYDEINRIEPGFNGGWKSISGPMAASNKTEADLVNFEGSHYSDPVLSWLRPVGLTDLEFFNSPILGDSYANNIFVGDYNHGNLYYFELNSNRTNFVLPSIPDMIIDTEDEKSSIIFGKGFGSITDIVTGPDDGYMYILTYKGVIYRILPV